MRYTTVFILTYLFYLIFFVFICGCAIWRIQKHESCILIYVHEPETSEVLITNITHLKQKNPDWFTIVFLNIQK